MRIGIMSLLTDYGVPPDRAAKAVEDAGFDTFWFGDHTHLPVHSPEAEEQWWGLTEAYWRNLDIWTSMAMAASATTTLRLGTGVCLLTVRDPIAVAKTTATLDLLSAGRLVFGIGAGWNAGEMANHGTEYSSRWALVRERAEAIRRIWTNDRPEYHGEFVDFDPLLSYPKPVQRPHPPLVVGGNGPKAIELSVALGAHWMPLVAAERWPAIEGRFLRLREMWSVAGRDADSLRLIPFCLEPPTPEHVDVMAGLGVEELVVELEQHRDEPDRFLREVDALAREYL